MRNIVDLVGERYGGVSQDIVLTEEEALAWAEYLHLLQRAPFMSIPATVEAVLAGRTRYRDAWVKVKT